MTGNMCEAEQKRLDTCVMRTAKSPKSPDLQFVGRKHRTLQTHWNPKLDLRATIVQRHPMTTPLGKCRIMHSKRQADATPYAASLIEGMRDFGYTLETAMADIIDNSVTAGAGWVEILAETASDHPWIAILDDGVGMTEAELVEAMRPGSKNPLHPREKHDLGRFGLGLKSASFSQCRQLTVISCKGGRITAATWDLGRVAETNVWSVDLEDDLSELPISDRLPERGTIVLWRKLDRLSMNYRHDAEKRSGEINKAVSGAERHLRLCFHRYMDGNRPKLRLFLNGKAFIPDRPPCN